MDLTSIDEFVVYVCLHMFLNLFSLQWSPNGTGQSSYSWPWMHALTESEMFFQFLSPGWPLIKEKKWFWEYLDRVDSVHCKILNEKQRLRILLPEKMNYCSDAVAIIIIIMNRMPSLLLFDGRTGDKTVDRRRKTAQNYKRKARGKGSSEWILDILYPGPIIVKLMTSSSTDRDQLLRNHYALSIRDCPTPTINETYSSFLLLFFFFFSQSLYWQQMMSQERDKVGLGWQEVRQDISLRKNVWAE